MEFGAVIRVSLYVLFIGLGAWLFIPGLLRLLRPNPERRWPQVEGVVLQSRIKESGNDFGYLPDLSYDYTIEGRNYTCTKVAPLQREFLLKSSAERWLRKYHFGARVPVHVDPNDPRRAVIEPGQQLVSAFLRMCFGAGLLLVGAVSILQLRG